MEEITLGTYRNECITNGTPTKSPQWYCLDIEVNDLKVNININSVGEIVIKKLNGKIKWVVIEMRPGIQIVISYGGK